MSKSNIKNINTLNIKKEPSIVFSQSTYASLIFKLKKSTIWLSSHREIKNLIFVSNKNDHFFKYFQHLNTTKKYIKKKKVIIYNPTTINNFNSSEERLSLKRIKVRM